MIAKKIQKNENSTLITYCKCNFKWTCIWKLKWIRAIDRGVTVYAEIIYIFCFVFNFKQPLGFLDF